MQLDIFSQFEVSIIVPIVFLLKLYLFTAQINALFYCFNTVEINFQIIALLLKGFTEYCFHSILLSILCKINHFTELTLLVN
jgi:hypothetical protein